MTTQRQTIVYATLLGSVLALSGLHAQAAAQAGHPRGQAVQPQNPEESAEEVRKKKKKEQQQEQADQQRRQQQAQQRQQQQRAAEERKREQLNQQQQRKKPDLGERLEDVRQVELQKRQEQELEQRRRQEERLANQRRVSEQEQRERIRKQEQRLEAYRHNIRLREELAQRDAQILRQQKRMQQLRFQEQYEERLRAQRNALSRARYDYYNDPFYYTAPNYRYRRGGSYYRTNQYGIKQLERALQAGYNEGYRAGRADRQDRWRYDYRSTFPYRDASFGYEGRYIDQNEYNHYFREGFERGYDDGYYGRNKYGRRNSSGGINDEWLIAGAVVAAIIGYEILTD